jgi:hypothetical protein
MLIAACSLLVVIAGIYVLTPLFKEPEGNLEVELLAETELDRLLARKAVVYSNLKDLEFEYKMGRLADGDFRRLEDTIEREIATRKAKLFPGTAEQTRRCPSCGSESPVGKSYCADCGGKL